MNQKIFLRNLEYFFSELYVIFVKPIKTFVRIGRKNDDGYLLPEDLSGIHCCFSSGVR
jgi:hypothetical protein